MKSLTNFESLLTRPGLHAEIDREMAGRHLGEFVRQAWPIIEPSTAFVPGWHIDAIVEHLAAVSRGQIRNLLINVPPRHMKSLLVSVLWPAWEWITWPERRWLFSSYAASLSIRDSVKCRRLIESPWYRGLWGDVFTLTGDQNAKGRFDNSPFRLSVVDLGRRRCDRRRRRQNCVRRPAQGRRGRFRWCSKGLDRLVGHSDVNAG